MAPHVNIGKLASDASSTAQGVAAAGKSSPSTANAIALDRGNVLRIQHGAGTRIRASSGVLWITEEHDLKDHVLLPGDAIALRQNGLAIVLAHRRARVVLEVPSDGELPRAVEMALADGAPGTPIALAGPAPISLSAMTHGLATVFYKASALLRMIAGTLRSRWRAAALSTASVGAPMTASDGVSPRHLRRGTTHGTRKVERVVNEEWTIWRK